jgi:hypothetical protein
MSQQGDRSEPASSERQCGVMIWKLVFNDGARFGR